MRKLLSIMLLVVLIASGVTFADDHMTTFTIVHTNDTHARIEEGDYDGMGFAKIYTKVRMLEEEGKELLILDAGDTFHGQTIASLVEGESVVRVLNAIGYDAMTVGNHDFNYGQERLLELKDMIDFPMVSANIMKDGENFLPPYTMTEIDGVSIAIVGMTSPETSYKTHPKNVEGITFTNPIEAAREALAAVEDEADIVIGLFHVGVDESTEITSADIAEAVPGYDIIVDGHSHTFLPEGLVVGDTTIVMAGEYDKALGLVEVVYADGSLTVMPSHLTKEEAAELEDAEEITSLVADIKTQIEEITSVVVGEADQDLVGERELVRTGETNLGNLITNAMLDVTGADVAMTNGGGIRASIESGTVTKGDVITVLPFGNYIVTKEVSGADLLMAIEHGIDSYPATKGAFPHVGGMSFTFDPSKPAMMRVTEVTVDGEPLDIMETYVLATNDFMAAGGDDYTMFADDAILGEYPGLDEAVMDYIAEYGTAGAMVEGRVVAMDTMEESTEEPVVEGAVYTVVSGDALYKIAAKYDTTWQTLAEYNDMENPDLIFPGDEIMIPMQ